MTAEEAEARSGFGRWIPRSALPGDRATLRRTTADNGAPDEVLEALDRLPAGRAYRTVAEIWAAAGHTGEGQRW